MVRARSFFAAMALGPALVAAATAAPQAARSGEGDDTSSPSVQKLIENCDAHKFETIVNSVVDGQPHKSKVKLCGKEGQSDAEWIGTLKDAIAKLEANTEMSAAVRAQIVTAITTEISRLEIEKSAMPSSRTIAGGVPTARPDTLFDEYSSLPPLPSAPPPPPKVLGSGTSISTNASAKAARRVASRPVTSSMRPSSKAAPKLSFTCHSPDDIAGDAPCTGFDRETTLTIRANENVPAGLSILFLRNGEQRASVELAQLPRGRALRVPLPRAVCQGVGDGSLEFQVLENGDPVKSEGPYSLRC